MQKMFEAVWRKGRIIPKDSVDFDEQTRFMVIVVDDDNRRPQWRGLKGKFKDKLSSTEAFSRQKASEKMLEQ